MSSSKSDDLKIWKLTKLAEASKTVLEEKKRTLVDIPTRGINPLKRKVVSSSSLSSRPEWLINLMRKENGYDSNLIIEKRKLHRSDLSKAQSRLSIPINQVVSSDFLTEEETRIIYEQSELKIRQTGVSVVLFDPMLCEHVVDLRKWKIGGNWSYVIVDGWNDVVANNEFDVDDVIEIWSFRYGRGKLCFALSPPVRETRQFGQRSYHRYH
ncbi:unnamed protein product [Arabis nemorensis]|uniref:TF-B3 domain-containing protein n=1 Tax=Arabis nemorensis TaxID=586526 RepID=A0A565C1I4_9BRAS|nr:unnamed protein product [Arabis nemorensis]